MQFGEELTTIRSLLEPEKKGKMILGFKTSINGKPTNFVDKILKGEKVTTIREDKHNRWKVGRKIHFATGVRTGNQKQFAQGECTEIETIEIEYGKEWVINEWIDTVRVFINDYCLNYEEIKELVKNDGFDSVKDFFDWFNKGFKGKIIHFKV